MGLVAVAVGNVAGGIFGVVTILILSFYLLVEADSLRASFLRLFPRANRARVAAASNEVTVKVSAWLGGQLLLGTIIGTTSAIGLWALGVLVLLRSRAHFRHRRADSCRGTGARGDSGSGGRRHGFAEEGSVRADFFLPAAAVREPRPRAEGMSRQVGVSAVTVIVALLIGGELLGIVGAILAVPTAAILQVVASELLGERE